MTENYLQMKRKTKNMNEESGSICTGLLRACF